jgi:hypothetical protein
MGSSPVYASNETLWAPSIFMHPTDFRMHSAKFLEPNYEFYVKILKF